MTKFSWREGIPAPAVPAEVFGEVVERIEAEKGSVKPDDVLEAAQQPDSPIAGLFQWDDKAAANHYRRDQARHYLASLIVVRVRTHEGETASQRAYHVAERGGVRGYRGVQTILSDADMKAQLLDQAKRDLESFLRKYQSLIALSAYVPRLNEVVDLIRDEIDQLRTDATKRRASAQRRDAGLYDDARPTA